MCPKWKAQRKVLWAKVQKDTGRWKSRWKVRDFLADERCSRAVLDFSSTTGVGMLVPAEEEVGSEASEWELRERQEWEEEKRAEAEEVGAAGDEEEEYGADGAFFWLFLLSFALLQTFLLCNFLGAHLAFLGEAWAEGNGELATCRHRADSGQETDCT